MIHRIVRACLFRIVRTCTDIVQEASEIGSSVEKFDNDQSMKARPLAVPATNRSAQTASTAWLRAILTTKKVRKRLGVRNSAVLDSYHLASVSRTGQMQEQSVIIEVAIEAILSKNKAGWNRPMTGSSAPSNNRACYGCDACSWSDLGCRGHILDTAPPLS